MLLNSVRAKDKLRGKLWDLRSGMGIAERPRRRPDFLNNLAILKGSAWIKGQNNMNDVVYELVGCINQKMFSGEIGERINLRGIERIA